MNITELQNYIYSSAGNSISSMSSGAKATAVVGSTANSIEPAQNATAFSAALSEEVGKLNDNVKQVDKAAEFRKLATALDGSVLGTMTSNATDKDLAALSDDLLGSKGGREVLSKLMEGHFNSIAMSDSDDDKADKLIDNSVDSFSKSVDETQALLDSLEKVSAGMQTEE